MKARIGIIGCRHGSTHAGNFSKIENGELVGICDIDEHRLKQATDRFGCKGYEHYEKLLEKTKPQGVMVCTPPYVRMPLIQDLAQRGIAVFCEKPPAGDMETARAARRALEKNPVINAVGFMYRWAQAADYIKSLIGGRPVVVCQITGIWEVLYWDVSTDYFYRDRAGGPLVEQGVHLIDVARFVLEDEVDHVYARGGNLIHPLSDTFTTEETIAVSMKWRKGTLGSHIHCWTHHGHIFELLFTGVDFALTLDLKTNQVRGTDRGEPIDSTFGDDYYVTELSAFCDAILKNDQKLIRGSYADSCHTLAAAATAMQSIDLGAPLPVPHW